MLLLTEFLVGVVSILSVVLAGVLYWNLRQHGRITALEVWAQGLAGVVEEHSKQVARAITEDHLKLQGAAVERHFKEVDNVLLALADAAGRTTSQLRAFTEYGDRAGISETPTVESRITHIEQADTDKRTIIDPSQLHPDRVRDCCRFYANRGPTGSGARRDDCPPWEQLREFCLRLRAADSVQPGVFDGGTHGHTVPGAGLHGGPARRE